MGRSQVARNHRRGRPGTKGRGSNKDYATSNRIDLHTGHGRSLGDNSFRYQDTKNTSHGDLLGGDNDWHDTTMSGNRYGPSHDSVEIDKIGIPILKSIHMSGNKSDQSKIDINHLAAYLDGKESSSWMKLSTRMTRVFDEHFRDGKVDIKMTITEMSADFGPTSCGDCLEVEETTQEKVSKLILESSPCNNEDTINDGATGELDSEEEELNDWLDSVIQT